MLGKFIYIYIDVGLQALLGLATRAMREPQQVDRAQDWLHVFVCMFVTNIINLR